MASINAFLEGGEVEADPARLPSNLGKIHQGSIVLGDGFLLLPAEAAALISAEPAAERLVKPILNGQELNGSPSQRPDRLVIDFGERALPDARQFPLSLQRLEDLVLPVREKGGRDPGNWWQFWRPRRELYASIQHLSHCFVAARTTKHLSFSASPTRYVFSDALHVLATDRWDQYAVVQSSVHEVWARKYSGALETRLRYSPSDCFETFAFPGDLWKTANPGLAKIGEEYHERRRRLMRELSLGLTDIYNLFHARDLNLDVITKVSRESVDASRASYEGLLELRRLHVALDNAVRDAYGWSDLDLGHGFVEVDTLPENDRVRYTIGSEARKEVLKRLLALNHEHARQEAEEAAQTQAPAKGKAKRPTAKRGVKASPQLVPAGMPGFDTVLAQAATFPDAAWASVGEDPAASDTLALAATLKAFATPAPTQQVRLAAMLCAEPRLFAHLAPPQPLVDAWRRLVGDQAAALPASVSALAPPARTSFGMAVKKMRARGELIENMILDTWAPGAGLQGFDTSGWPDGRAYWVVGWLSSQNVAKLLQGLPAELAQFVNEQAA